MILSSSGLPPPWQQPAISCRHCSIVCGASSSLAGPGPEKKEVVLIGGTGRVGSSTARALARVWPDLQLVLAGRNRERGEGIASEIGAGTKFRAVDIEDLNSVAQAIEGAKLVIHSAGPFQRKNRCTVLEAAIETKVPYIDVCDDLTHAQLAKSLHNKAVEAGVPAIITTGLYPGVSNIMAAELVRLARESSAGSRPRELRFSYFTAGSGGVGPTILATSFLLLSEQVLTYSKGKVVKLDPFSGERIVDFGKAVGKRSVFLINLPEVVTAFENLKVPTITARFGTAPFFWNWIMGAIAGRDFLKDDSKVQSLAKISAFAVRIIDRLVGAKVSMRVDLSCTDGKRAVGLYTHRNLSVCVGSATAAFAAPVLQGKTRPGVWFPEQDEAIPFQYRGQLLQQASKGTSSFVMNRSPWMVEGDPKEIGFGIYLE
ncbi:uncharacterized protein LOC9641433 [Selaginella moellendorffii]|uniref:uncharacterized protein LOC9641433 n=1 Tax=Selaginella moellendorffii TaxID=88036 RepID=UPI000D1D091A|nr:uncharacterized protein LOC9641433 [Selaginella moellendorffii]|eukprot:XP_024528585.1 uncharacterized protein LOC9641433 [Selaginella moellendorffii]